jgi:glyoxylase-like metal-dependent hydrolase (beta-lactamase superfamily II)
MNNVFEAYALRYGQAIVKKSEKYYRWETYGEPDEAVDIYFYFWLLRNERQTILVDCGFSDAAAGRRGFSGDVSPMELLLRFGVEPEDVDHVILTHMHFDHMGNFDRFPNADFTVARAEFDFCTGPHAKRPLLFHSHEQDEVDGLVRLKEQGRVRLVEGRSEIFPGIVAHPIGGHTPGLMVLDVATANGQVVLASDAIHFYEQMEKDRPYWIFTDLAGMYHGYDFLRGLEARPNTWIVSGHDPQVMMRFEAVDGDCVDLSLPAHSGTVPEPVATCPSPARLND